MLVFSIETNLPAGRNKAFTVFSNESKKWARDGCEYLAEYIFGKGTYFVWVLFYCAESL